MWLAQIKRAATVGVVPESRKQRPAVRLQLFFSQLEQHKQLDDPRRLIGERISVRRAARRAKISGKTTAQRWPISCFRAVLKLVRDLCSDFALHAHELMWRGKKLAGCQKHFKNSPHLLL